MQHHHDPGGAYARADELALAPIIDVDTLEPAELRPVLMRIISEARVCLLMLDDEQTPDVDPLEDMEPEDYDGPLDQDDEHSLGWTTHASAFQHHLGSADPDGEPSLGGLSAMNQRDWSKGDNRHDDGETTLGAPERHPYVWDAGGRPLGKGWHRYVDRSPDARQTDWAAGSRQEGEGEAEPGYDLPEGDDERCGSDDVEGEDSLGWPEHFSQLAIGREGSGFWGSGDGDSTAPETHGKGFVRCAPDDMEDCGEAERDDEHGSDDGEDFGHHASQFRPGPLSRGQREVADVLVARTAAIKKKVHPEPQGNLRELRVA